LQGAIEALRRNLPHVRLDEPEIPAEVLENLRVLRDDFSSALKRVQPSALREIMARVPDVGWEDIGGLEEVKRALREGVELPLKHPEDSRRVGIRPAKGFLMLGQPGTGQTLLAKAVARESAANFIATKSSDLLSKWGTATRSDRSLGCSGGRDRWLRRLFSWMRSNRWPRSAAAWASRPSPSAW
jgi:transitional endoplasmic reticulum ATPase